MESVTGCGWEMGDNGERVHFSRRAEDRYLFYPGNKSLETGT